MPRTGHIDIYHTILGAVTYVRSPDDAAVLYNNTVTDTIGMNLLPFLQKQSVHRNITTLVTMNNDSTQQIDVTVESALQESVININSSALLSSEMSSRPFYWRAGHYNCLIYNNYKLQISKMPDKIWYFDLNLDPTELSNIAVEVLNITTYADWIRFNATVADIDINEHTASTSIHIIQSFIQMMTLLTSIELTYIQPVLWESVLLWVQAIDKVDHGHSLVVSDEYVYWPL